jgi:hypothetical protein
MKNIKYFKPAVPKKLLLLLAGVMWLVVGIMLNYLAYGWLVIDPNISKSYHIISGVITAIFIYRFGFSKIAKNNHDRIIKMADKSCIFSFYSLKSYLTIIVMVLIGIALRHSTIPKHYLAVAYIGIGLALAISSNIYFETILSGTNDG